MRLVFFGSGEFGLPTLEALAAGHQVVAVVSQPDKPAGRNRTLTPTPIAAWALARNLPLLRPENANTPESVAWVRDQRPDASVIIAFGQKLSPELIGACGALAINLHGSLLPAYRGAAPIQRALMQGETHAGVTVIALAQKMDAGVMYGTDRVEIGPSETAGELHDRLSLLGPALVGRVLADHAAGRLAPVAQNEGAATRATKLAKEDGTVDVTVLSAAAARARINGLNPWPGCRLRWLSAGGPKELIVRRCRETGGSSSAAPGSVLAGAQVVCADGRCVELLELQAAGGKALPADVFIRGHGGPAAGDRVEAWDWAK